MDFLKNNKLMMIALVQSLIRWLIAVAVTKYAVTELDQGKIDETAATLSVLFVGVVSIAWSTFTHKTNIDTPPPKDPPGGGSSSSRIGPTITLLAIMFTAGVGSAVLLGGCAGQQARERIAVPATVKSVDNIAADAAFGIPLLAEEDRANAQADLDAFVEAVKSADIVTIQTQAYARWPVVKSLVESGLNDRLEKGTLGPNGFQLRLMRVRSYGDTLEQLVFGPLAK